MSRKQRAAVGDGWKRICPRVYELRTENAQAFVFGSSAPLQLWAWAVYGPRATLPSSGVKLSLGDAKGLAKYAVDRIEAKSGAVPGLTAATAIEENMVASQLPAPSPAIRSLSSDVEREQTVPFQGGRD